MPSVNKSGKKAQIEKSNTFMFVVIGIAATFLSFTIVSGIALSRRLAYQSRAIDARSKAEKQIKENKKAIDKLIVAYETFDKAPESVIGTKDSNSRVVLDALPSKYDFPALATSVEKLIKITGGVGSLSIVGSDQEATAEQSSISPKPKEIPLNINGTASYDNIQKLVNNLQLSIRPFKINRIVLSGDQSGMIFNTTMVTYYMPAKNLEIQLEEIK